MNVLSRQAMKIVLIISATAISCVCGFSSGPDKARRVSATSSPLFKTTTRQELINSPRKQPTNPLFILSASSDPFDAEITGSKKGPAVRIPEKSPTASQSIFQIIDDAGTKLKPRAFTARDKALTFTNDKKRRILYTAKACSYLSLFIIYRAYRGLFVILPAVFREVYQKMELAVDSPLEEKDGFETDVSAKTGKARFRTSVVVSALSGILTVSYVVSGAFKVLVKFIGTASKTSSVEPAFEAAVEEVLANEDKMFMFTNKKLNGSDLGP